MILKEEMGDLFNLPTEYTLVHCISQDCAMAAGIAVTFERKFQMRQYLKNYLKDNNLEYPCALLFKGNEQNVVNLVTKSKYWHKPTYGSLEETLDLLVTICKNNNITKLGMPRIGCGLDRLEWSKVKSMIEDKFKDTDVEIQVRYI